MKKWVIAIVFVLGTFSVMESAEAGDRASGGRGGAPARIDEKLVEAEHSAVEWIKGQMVPNDAVPVPDPGRRRLLLSYRVPKEDPAYPYIYSRSFIYDNALAAIALTMVGEYRQAEYLLSALKRLVREDGSLWFAYNTANEWPSEGDNGGALIRTGSVSWVGYAMTFYLGARANEDAAFLGEDPVALDLLKAAESIARFLLANQIQGKSDPRYGLVTGGTGTYTLTVRGGSEKPAEEYAQATLQWVSMEHNLDAYFFLRDLGRLTSSKQYASAAELVGKRLLGLWSDKEGQFFQGILETKAIDTALPLDGASWGALFLTGAGRDGEAKRCIAAMGERFQSRDGKAAGFRPYALRPVYEDERVNRYYFPDGSPKLWRDLDFVWGEGSLGAAAALIRCGFREKGQGVIESSLALGVEGGFKYASRVVPYQFNDYPSVATTAWFIIAMEMLRGGPVADAFWGK